MIIFVVIAVSFVVDFAFSYALYKRKYKKLRREALMIYTMYEVCYTGLEFAIDGMRAESPDYDEILTEMLINHNFADICATKLTELISE